MSPHGARRPSQKFGGPARSSTKPSTAAWSTTSGSAPEPALGGVELEAVDAETRRRFESAFPARADGTILVPSTHLCLLAKRLKEETKSDAACVERAWELCFQRPPTLTETADATAFIEQEGLVQFSRAMLNANEFVFIP